MSNNSVGAEAAAMIMRLMNGAWIARIVHTAAEIGIVDHLDDQPRHAQWLASASGTHAPSLARLLRALAAIGIVAESDQRQYTLTFGRGASWRCSWLDEGVGADDPERNGRASLAGTAEINAAMHGTMLDVSQDSSSVSSFP